MKYFFIIMFITLRMLIVSKKKWVFFINSFVLLEWSNADVKLFLSIDYLN